MNRFIYIAMSLSISIGNFLMTIVGAYGADAKPAQSPNAISTIISAFFTVFWLCIAWRALDKNNDK